MKEARRGLILLVHGSRDPAWPEPLAKLLAELSAASGQRFSLACLQFGRPTLEEAVSELAGEGVLEIVIVPGFISGRGHVLRDLPALERKVRGRYPGARLTMTAALGEQPEAREAFKACLLRLVR